MGNLICFSGPKLLIKMMNCVKFDLATVYAKPVNQFQVKCLLIYWRFQCMSK